MRGIRGQNYYKVINMKLSGMKSNHVAKSLNLSRERVRQLWLSYQIKDNKDDFRNCSKCNKKFLPKYNHQSTCGCYVSTFDNCIICNKPTQFLRKRTVFPICKNIECVEHRNVLKSQLKKLSKEKISGMKVNVTCSVCGVHHRALSWRAQSSNFKVRCKSCRDGQKRGICTVCKIPVTKTNGKCKRHSQLATN